MSRYVHCCSRRSSCRRYCYEEGQIERGDAWREHCGSDAIERPTKLILGYTAFFLTLEELGKNRERAVRLGTLLMGLV